MSEQNSSFKTFKETPRKLVTLAKSEIITATYLDQVRRLPLVIKPAVDNLDAAGWVQNNRDYLERELEKHGAVLFRGFRLESTEEFERIIGAASGDVLEYNERTSPRTRISGHIYTSTDYPEDKNIYLHNEQSYNLVFPLKIFFFCAKKAKQGGATPIADTRNIYHRISAEIRSRFKERKYMYVRNYGDGLGLSWQEAFQTERKTDVQDYCRKNMIVYEWKDGNRLRTKQIRETAAKHPKTGEWVWFNHLTFFHVSTLDQQLKEDVISEFSEEDLPNNTYYGDGEPIEASVMKHLREAYEQEKFIFDWEERDLLMLDNMLAAHGREPYNGHRRVAVGMAEPWRWGDL
jgi:alpha-ketoglutarate-dependent taurine dioxygenase